MWKEGMTTKPQNYSQNNYTSITQVNKQKGARKMKTIQVMYIEIYKSRENKKKYINKRIYKCTCIYIKRHTQEK